MSSSKRHSILPPVAQAGPKAPVRFEGRIVIADSAILTGTHAITVGADSVIHPRARIESVNGPVTIGRLTVVHEKTTIGAGGAAGEDAVDVGDGGVRLGDFVTVEVSAKVETGGTTIGDGSVVGIGCRVGRGARIGKYCTITPTSQVAPGDVIPDFTVVYSNGMRRADKRGVVELKEKSQKRQIEILTKLIPSNPARFQ